MGASKNVNRIGLQRMYFVDGKLGLFVWTIGMMFFFPVGDGKKRRTNWKLMGNGQGICRVEKKTLGIFLSGFTAFFLL